MSSFEQKLHEITELISLPEIYLRIRRLMADPTSEIDEFAEVIRIDPGAWEITQITPQQVEETMDAASDIATDMERRILRKAARMIIPQ